MSKYDQAECQKMMGEAIGLQGLVGDRNLNMLQVPDAMSMQPQSPAPANLFDLDMS